jgi:hypothetical protein
VCARSVAESREFIRNIPVFEQVRHALNSGAGQIDHVSVIPD